MAYTTIDDPSVYFQTTLYTGTGSDQNIVNGGNSDLQPDWVWVKDRSATNDHKLTDSNRLGSGGGPTRTLESNTTVVEYDDNDSGTEATKTFNTDGFTIGPNGNYNTDGNTYVAWQWKANGGTRTTNTESGDNPAGGYQANTTAGFSIVDWTGTGGAGGLMAHGLGAVPHTIITKTRSHANAWAVYHHKNTDAPETDYLKLDSTAATADNVNRWNDTAPTSTNLVLGDVGGVNGNDQTQIAYVFTEIQGYSKFGSYVGNGNDDGPFLYTGFKPAMFFRKRTDGANGWNIWDSKRTPFNEMHTSSAIHTNAVEDSNTGYNDVDFLSNGIKIHDTGDSHNGDGFNYVYWAWAESPFVSSEGVPTTAR